MPAVGVAMTTHNRPGVRARAIRGWTRHLPAGAVFVLVDDASTPPAAGAAHRFDSNVGIATAKNKAIELLHDAGVEHFFLTDDDCWPITPDWWQPYTTAGVGHLMHCWGKSRLVEEGDQFTVWSNPRGVMLYTRRGVIQRVGGMRTDFPRWGSEHTEWSRRIHNAGLTPYPFMDVTGSRKLWFCTDYTRSVPSTATDDERAASQPLRAELIGQYRHSSDFVPFRQEAA